MKVTSCVAAAVSAGLSALTLSMGVAYATPIPAPPRALVSPPTGIGWSWEWDDDDDDWNQTTTWQRLPASTESDPSHHQSALLQRIPAIRIHDSPPPCEPIGHELWYEL